MNWRIERKGPVTTTLRVEAARAKGWEQWALLTGDRHLDNPHSDRKLQEHHLKQAVDRGAFVIDVGDTFDAMQGKSDKRSSKSDLMARHKAGNYLNLLVKDGAEFFAPYANNLALMGKGNHETGVEKAIEYDLLDGLLFALSGKGTPIMNGGYRGWIRILFEAGTVRQGINLYYHHGYGGGGPVTKDTIQATRKAVYLPDATIAVSGHTHDQWWFPVERVRLLESGREIADTQHHIKVPSYKDEFTEISGGFHHEKGRPPKPKGAFWARFYYSPRTERIEVEFIAAEK